jgi:GT2 family glycosyltransferase
MQIPLPAPVMGRGDWVGYIPDDTEEIWLSPGHGAIHFCLELEDWRILSPIQLVNRLLRQSPWGTLGAVTAFWLIKRNSLQTVIRWILDGVEFSMYDQWRSRRTREFNSDTIDRPRMEWHVGPTVLVVCDCSSHPSEDSALASIASLEAQLYPNWHAILLGMPEEWRDHSHIVTLLQSGRFTCLPITSTIAALPTFSARTIVTSLELGDRLPAWAFALVAQHAVDQSHLIIYGDEDCVDCTGRFSKPKFKPDWSRVFQALHNYVGNAVYYDISVLCRYPSLSLEQIPKLSSTRDGIEIFSAFNVGHVRRILLSKLVANAPVERARDKQSAIAVRSIQCTSRILEESARPVPSASIIIPSKDKAALIEECTLSLFRTVGDQAEIIVVDNGSVERETWSLYDKLMGDHRFRVLCCPGSFNYSKLCNYGAANSNRAALVFLNNDTVVLSEQWLQELIRAAQYPGVGAVGARLLYPNRRVQHAGVTLGLWGTAGHCDVGASEEERGYMDKLLSTHEVSAVTGACLAIEKVKFDAVGGFDDVNLPVDLNDIDLCLRLSQRGWKTLYIPAAVLIHKESASRGRTADHAHRYPREIAYFRSRWGGALHDDPYFHPALSLNAQRTLLS